MNWTSTQHPGWREECREFAAARAPFRLDHVAGVVEQAVCEKLCAELGLRQEKRGSSVLFTEVPS